MAYPVRFHYAMCAVVEDHALAGLTGNAELAEILADVFDMPATATHIAQWRRQHPRFNRAVINALHNLDRIAIGNIRREMVEGDVVTSKWWLERRNPLFKPSSKVEHGGKVEGLAELLQRRTSDQELEQEGVLIYD
jgi:hypothetical protein